MSSIQTAPEAGRFPCRACAELIPLEARLCHHCQTSALVDLVLRAPVTNPRQRHQAGRALQAVPGSPALLRVQENMIAARPFVARGVTRAFAEQALGILAE